MWSSGRDGVRDATAADDGRRAVRGSGRIRQLDLEHAERRAISKRPREQRHRHVVYRYVVLGAPLEPASVRVTVHDQRHRIAADGFLQPARTEERINLQRLAFYRLLNR